jgi:hypothetical protein
VRTVGVTVKSVLLVLLFVFALAADAQSTAKVELGIGYSYARMPVPLSGGAVNNHAVVVDATANVNRRLGITSEFAAYYHCVSGCQPYSDISRNNSFVVLIGPKIRLRGGKYVPWVHALGGFGNLRFSNDLGAGSSWTGGAAAVGGGLDITYHRFGFRVAQVDYFRTPGLLRHNNVRLSAGFLINLGTVK